MKIVNFQADNFQRCSLVIAIARIQQTKIENCSRNNPFDTITKKKNQPTTSRKNKYSLTSLYININKQLALSYFSFTLHLGNTGINSARFSRCRWMWLDAHCVHLQSRAISRAHYRCAIYRCSLLSLEQLLETLHRRERVLPEGIFFFLQLLIVFVYLGFIMKQFCLSRFTLYILSCTQKFSLKYGFKIRLACTYFSIRYWVEYKRMRLEAVK